MTQERLLDRGAKLAGIPSTANPGSGSTERLGIRANERGREAGSTERPPIASPGSGSTERLPTASPGSGTGSGTVGAPEEIAWFLESNADRLTAACAQQIDPKKLARLCAQIVADDKTGALRRCSKESFLHALLDAFSCGVLPTHGRGYLIPYKGEVKFQLSYLGILEIAARAGITAKPYLIFRDDEFDWVAGTEESILHKPRFGSERTAESLIGAYVVARMPDGSRRIEVMTKAEIDAIREKSPSKDIGPWKTDYLEMAKKTVVRRASKYWPITYELTGTDPDTDPEPGLAVGGLSAVAASRPRSLARAEDLPDDPEIGRTDPARYEEAIVRAQSVEQLRALGGAIKAEGYDAETRSRLLDTYAVRYYQITGQELPRE